MEKIKVIDIIGEIKEKNKNLEVEVDSFVNYNNDEYVCDVVGYLSDNNIDIYYSDLFDWAKGNYSYIDDAIKEFGKPDNFLQYIQQGQYLYYEQEIYDNIDQYIKLYCFNYLLRDKDVEEITEDQFNEIMESLENIDNNDRLWNIEAIIDELFED